MPTLPPVPKVIRFDVRQTLSGDSNVLNRVFYQYSGTLSAADLQTLCNTLATAWHANIQPQQSASISLNQVTGTDLTSVTAPQFVLTASGAGSLAGSDLGAAVAAVIKKKIARRYRGGHARDYMAGLQFSQLLNLQTLTSAAQTAIASAWSSFNIAMVTSPPVAVGTLTLVSISYFLGFTNVTNPVTGRTRPRPSLRGTPLIDVVTSISVNPRLGSQRRRNLQSP